MAQGTRVSRNLFYENAGQDLFVEVNHGPFVADNNLFLSPTSILDMSEGGAYAHNLFAGRITNRPEPSRETPFHPPHSTTVAGLAVTTGGDNRFFNNVFVGTGQAPTPAQKGNLKELRWISSHGLWGYDGREFPLQAAGNVYYFGSEPSAVEMSPVVRPDHAPAIRLVEKDGQVVLHYVFDTSLLSAKTVRVDTARLGEPKVSKVPYVNPDGSSVVLDRDYLGRRRSGSSPSPGPFEKPKPGAVAVRVW
jgi:hypothetical protein